MPVTAAAFNTANKIVYQTKIMHYNLNRGSGATADFIDLNHNGVVDSGFQKTGWTTARDLYNEPELTVSFQNMADQAKALGQGEVLTQEDLANIQIDDISVDWGTTVFTHTAVNHGNTRSLAALIPQLAPIGSNNACAINTETGEFYIYTPNKGA
jgi:hypothetical protein